MATMNFRSVLRHPGVLAALAAALLFGAATPLAKSLLQSVSPWLLAGLLYLGSGLGLTLYRLACRAPSVRLLPHERNSFVAAIFFGGIVGPVLLMFGLSGTSAADASLLLNAEGVFTALLAGRHSHRHVHEAITHAHQHFPDAHHTHRH